MVEKLISVNILISGLGGGGAERVVSELLLSPSPNNSVYLSVNSLKNKAYSIGDVGVFAFDEMNTSSLLSRALYRLPLRMIYNTYMHYLYLQRMNIDVSVSFMTYSNVTNLINSLFLHVPVVISIRNNLLEQYGGGILVRVQRMLLRITSPYVIVNSESNKEWLISEYHLNKDRCISIYNPKDIVSIRNLSQDVIEDIFFQTDSLLLLTVGRLVHQKGHVHLLRVFHQLNRVFPCRLVICGVGLLEESLKTLAKELNLLDDVYFAGFCDNPYKYMKRADIFVFPSLYEGQPNAMIEALICGCPIVSTDCDYGPREILANGKYGILTKKLDGKIDNPLTTPLTDAEQDMYDKVLYLMQHPEERERLRQLSSEQIHLFDKERCIKKYYDVFRAAAEGRLLTDIN